MFLTAQQCDRISDVQSDGAEISEIRVHPFSGAATLYAPPLGQGVRQVLAIVESDGRVDIEPDPGHIDSTATEDTEDTESRHV